MTSFDYSMGGYVYLALGIAAFLFVMRRLNSQQGRFQLLAQTFGALLVLTISSLPSSNGSIWQRRLAIAFGLAATLCFLIGWLQGPRVSHSVESESGRKLS